MTTAKTAMLSPYWLNERTLTMYDVPYSEIKMYVLQRERKYLLICAPNEDSNQTARISVSASAQSD